MKINSQVSSPVQALCYLAFTLLKPWSRWGSLIFQSWKKTNCRSLPLISYCLYKRCNPESRWTCGVQCRLHEGQLQAGNGDRVWDTENSNSEDSTHTALRTLMWRSWEAKGEQYLSKLLAGDLREADIERQIWPGQSRLCPTILVVCPHGHPQRAFLT